MSFKLHWETHGEGRQTLVICNGLSQSTANWRGLARQNGQYRWLLFDTRGHGKSELGPQPYCLDDHVDDLLRVLDEAQIEKPYLLGFSHGGRVALRAAATAGDRFAGLVLVSCASRQSVRRKAHVRAWHECLKLGGVAGLAWSSLPNIVGAKILHKFDDLGLLVKGSVARNNQAGLLAMFDGMRTYPEAEADARRVKIPSLILHGADDPLVDSIDIDNLSSWIENASRHSAADCGHTLPLEEPTLFMDYLEAFLTKQL